MNLDILLDAAGMLGALVGVVLGLLCTLRR